MKSSWPENVRGDVLMAWRQELGVSRAALARLLCVGYQLVWYHESETNRQLAIRLATAWRVENPERHARNVAKYQPRMKEISRRYYIENKEKLLIEHKEYRETHADQMKEYVRRYRENNMPKILELDRRWRQQHADQARAYAKKWRDNNPIKSNANCRNRRARKFAASGTCSVEQLEARIAFYGGLCAYCRKVVFEEIDHVIPLSRGGSNWPANLRPACKRCNLSKHNKTLQEWAAWKERKKEINRCVFSI